MNRDRDIFTLWRERPLDQQKEMDVMSLHSYIQKNQPELFHGIGEDPYQYLMRAASIQLPRQVMTTQFPFKLILNPV